MAATLALFTSVAYGLSNYVGPRLARDASLFVLLIVGQVIALALAAGLVVVQAEPVPGLGPFVAALAAGVGNAVGLVLFYRAAAIGPLSIVTPIGSMSVAVPVAYAVAQGESLTALKLAAIVLAIGGLVLVARRPATPGAPAGNRSRALVLAGGAAVGFGLFLAAMGPASEGGTGWAVMLSRVTLLVVLGLVATHDGESLRTPAARLPVLAIPGVLLFAGTLSYASATTLGDLSVVSVLGSLFPVVTIGLAIGLDHERLSRIQLVGVAATLAGVVVLSAR